MIAIRPGACAPPPNTRLLRTILDVTALSALESDVGEKHTHVRSRLGRVQLFISRICRGKESPPPKAEGRSAGGKDKADGRVGDKEEEEKKRKKYGYEVRGRKCRRHNLCLCRDVFIAFIRRVYKSVTAIFTSEQSDMSAF